MEPITDFGYLLKYFGIWLVENWWSVQLTFFGKSVSIGVLTAWVIIGSILIKYINILMGDDD